MKDRMPLSKIIGRELKLHRAGREYDALCPFHHDTSLGSFKVNDGKGIYFCFSCGATGDLFRWLAARQGWRFSQAVVELERELGGGAAIALKDPVKRAEWDAEQAARAAADAADVERRRKRAANLWHGSEPIGRDGVATPALAYLAQRGIDFAALGRIPGSLRWRPDIGHPDFKGQPDNRHAAMIASIHALDGSVIGCHRTYLDISGWDHATRSGVVTKLGGVSDAKLTLGPSLGGHIPVWKGDFRGPLHAIPAGTRVYLSEGIEDGASVAVSDPARRVIAGVSASKMPSVDLPPQMGELVLIGQRDKRTGEPDDLFEKAVAAHQEKGRSVSIMWPPAYPPLRFYKDFNDVLTGKLSAYDFEGDGRCRSAS
ncbi:CHC2 zinc finger domain-containing protein [Sphingopyxis sp. SCN 67-31]|uniref:CHC2 zinc finger domain-containing protein n=1 Tax=Sphingopyxis sp. SCN 67-31 TaxID=1660142 RepID=UPI002580AA42|nr:CHC2 zinc finger domain-containing protein [Sphingopyxis sp. SCN 67-31]